MFGGVLEWRPRPTPGCSAVEEEEEDILSTAQILLDSALLFYVILIIVIFFNFSKHNIKTPWIWCKITETCRDVCNIILFIYIYISVHLLVQINNKNTSRTSSPYSD
jgi:hypothetical protein